MKAPSLLNAFLLSLLLQTPLPAKVGATEYVALVDPYIMSARGRSKWRCGAGATT